MSVTHANIGWFHTQPQWHLIESATKFQSNHGMGIHRELWMHWVARGLNWGKESPDESHEIRRQIPNQFRVRPIQKETRLISKVQSRSKHLKTTSDWQIERCQEGRLTWEENRNNMFPTRRLSIPNLLQMKWQRKSPATDRI
jgi:hypothetical protein